MLVLGSFCAIFGQKKKSVVIYVKGTNLWLNISHQTKLTMLPPKNARYCNMCNDFRPVACFLPTTVPVENNATVCSQRKNNVCNLHDNEEEKERFCKVCDKFSPVSNFPPGQKGYLCRKH